MIIRMDSDRAVFIDKDTGKSPVLTQGDELVFLGRPTRLPDGRWEFSCEVKRARNGEAETCEALPQADEVEAVASLLKHVWLRELDDLEKIEDEAPKIAYDLLMLVRKSRGARALAVIWR